MTILKGSLAAVISLLLLLTVLWAQQGTSPKDAVTIKTFSSHRGLEAGGEFKVGVLFELGDGWHIYWKNPGEAGLPTWLKVGAGSELVESGDVNWPIPIRFMQPGGILGYGYHKEAFFEIPVRIVGEASPGPLELEVDLSWLLCSESVCIPGSYGGVLELELGDRSVKSNDFKVFNKKAPVYPEIIRQPYSQSVRVSHRDPTEQEHDKLYRIAVDWSSDPGEVELFLTSDRQVKVELVETETGKMETEVDLAVQIRDRERVSEREVELLVVPGSESGEKPLSIRIELDIG